MLYQLEDLYCGLSWLEPQYAKWSLSGTHLMFVIAGKIPANTTITTWNGEVSFIMPDYINQKVYNVFGDLIGYISAPCYYYTDGGAFGGDGEVEAIMGKETATHKLRLRISGANKVTSTKDRYIRIQYDLIIDNE